MATLERVDRPPRIQPDLPFKDVPISRPPEDQRSFADQLIQLLLPLITIVGFIFVSGSGNPLAIIPMGLMMSASVGVGIFSFIRERRRLEANKRAYKALLLELREQMERDHNTQRLFFQFNYPDVPALLDIADVKRQHENSRFGPRLWERRPGDRDFGAIRLGVGSRPSTTVYTLSESSDPINESELSKDARKLASDSRVVVNTAVTLPLRTVGNPDGLSAGEGDPNKAVIVGKHTIGIVGRSAATSQTYDFVRATLAHFCAFHSPTDAQVFVIGHARAASNWTWAEWLPHVSPPEEDEDPAARPGTDRMCFSDALPEQQAFWKRIKKVLDQRQVRLRETKDDPAKASGDVSLPFMLIVVDMLGDLPADSPLRDVASEAVVALITSQGAQLGASILFAANDTARVPSECLGMIEIELSTGQEKVFRYAEVGVNAQRLIGVADQLDADDARHKFAARIRRLELQRPFGADLPRSADLMQMHGVMQGKRVDTVDQLPIPQNWQASLQPAKQEWLRAPIGLISGKEVRQLVFSAREDGDGVHGMVAGTTGSGKSELLLTLIAEMAMKYDPRIVNFVLVDYKGGSSLGPAKHFPHVVDFLTNQKPNAVERMFVAIQAVMEQRQRILEQANAKDIVDYRQKVVPKLPPDSVLPRDFPHLFIIVDEFAEMITANPDYKSKFESVTRLGRSFGVSLILATQRPAGVVTDQMRANMKFRICLRVETTEDSKELLEQPDAAFLPNLGGRGYIKVGNDVITPIQVAWAGKPYNDKRVVAFKDVYWLDDERLPDMSALQNAPLYNEIEIGEALHLKPSERPGTVLDWVAGITVIRAQRDGVPPQTKPWPDPLPEFLSLTQPFDARYLNTERPLRQDRTLVIDPSLAEWLAGPDAAYLWPDHDWAKPRPLRADIGVVDNPFQAEQRLLTIDLADGPVAIFGSAGRGKSTFAKTLLTALAAQRTPRDLNMYLLDFGADGLKEIKDLPHVGAVLKVGDSARVDQMIRMLRNFVNERSERLQAYGSLAEHNAKNPNFILPDVVFVVDNFNEFKENYEHLIQDLMSIVRDGRSFGVHFIVTATLPNDLTNKLFNLFPQRLALTLPDAMHYLDIAGGAPRFDNVPGRGVRSTLVKDHPQALEFQIGVPGVLNDDVDEFKEIATRMDRAWLAAGGKRPAAELPRTVTLFDMFRRVDGKETMAHLSDLDFAAKWERSMQADQQQWLRAPIGLVSSTEVRELRFQAQEDGVHGMAAGTTGSGKSELLQTLIASMAIRYDPRVVNFVLIDYKGGPTVEPFRKLPHCVDIATNLEGNKVERIFTAIRAEMDRRSDLLAKAGAVDLVEYRKKVVPRLAPDSPFPRTFPHLFVIVDEFAEMVQNNPDYKLKFESITRLGRSFGVSLILATQRPSGVVSDQMRANMKFRLCLRVETPEDSKELLKRPDAARLPQIAGRGYIQAGTELLTEVQAAWSGAPFNGDDAGSPYSSDAVMDYLRRHADPPKEGEPARDPDAPRSLLGWLVGAMAVEAERRGIPKQFKPWPDPLPAVLPVNTPIDASYLHEFGGVDGSTAVLDPTLAWWAAQAAAESPGFAAQAAGHWKPVDWRKPLSLRSAIGVLDDPFSSNQRLLSVDVAQDPIAIFGGSGRGKTTFVKAYLFALAARMSPADLNIYALDFGRGALRSVRELPHCGATIEASQPDRVAALFRMIRGIMNERAEKMDKGKHPTFEDYNARHADNPEALFPAIVFVIDNFAEFKENFENSLPELLSLVRDGRSLGVYFIITAGQYNDIPTKLLNLMGLRAAFTLPDASSYIDIVGRGFLPLPDVRGRGLINHKGQPLEFHIATPVIAGEGDAYMRIAERMEQARAALKFKKPSAEIPKAVTLLQMFQQYLGKPIDRVGDIPISQLWRDSMQPERQEWLAAPLGYVSSKELRSMLFSAKAGGDGVHGLAAGTTGSGKSEMLQTLIVSLALKYDPRIVNFVLVDYKGGPTVEPFRALPHVVDIATNLEGNKVDRIFTAINAEMNRRSAILAKAGVADLVEYRKKVVPTLKEDRPDRPRTFPHLFIIVDEFAEMISNNPEFKTQFESITRLGRSFGVSLLLAAQRPTGVVTDQMRANMKYRICLRVETADDSKELLKRADAAQLPAIGGRGYIQVGGGDLQEVQVAWSGAPYDETKPDPVYPVPEILDALEKQDDPPRSLLGWVVGALAAEYKRQAIPKQFKPWPDPLPDVLPSNLPFGADYIKDKKDKPGDAEEIVIDPAVRSWLDQASAGWTPHDFAAPLPLVTRLGVMDNPYLAEQRLVKFDLRGDPIIVFGAPGRGKTTFLKSLILSLAAQRSPAELHIYALDFGRGGLRALRKLPHIGGIVEVNEEERVERFFRIIRNAINERQALLQAYESFDDYNAKNPAAALPAIVVVIDNAVEFKETYDKYQSDLISLVRDGRSFGITFVVTATLFSDVPYKLFSLLGQRVSFAQSDPSDFQSIFNRRVMRPNDVPGRGLAVDLVNDEPVPLEFQLAVPMDERVLDELRQAGAAAARAEDGAPALDAKALAALMRRASDETMRRMVDRMAAAWSGMERASPELRARRVQTVEPLAAAIDLRSLLGPAGSGAKPVAAPIGVNDVDRMPARIELGARGPHVLVTGPPMSGKTTALRSLVLSLAHAYSPDELAMVFIDPSDSARRFYNFGVGEATLDKLPHVLATVTNAKELDAVALKLAAELDEMLVERFSRMPDVYHARRSAGRSIVVVIDHYDDIESLARGARYGLPGLAATGKGKPLHVVLSGSLQMMRGSGDDLRKRVESSRYSLVLQDFEHVRYMGVRVAPPGGKEMPPGRGYLVKSVTASLLQIAGGAGDSRAAEASLAATFDDIAARGHARAAWCFHGDDVALIETVAKGETAEQGAAQPAAAPAAILPSAEPVIDLSSLTSGIDDLLKSLAIQMPDQLNLVSGEFEKIEQPETPSEAAPPQP